MSLIETSDQGSTLPGAISKVLGRLGLCQERAVADSNGCVNLGLGNLGVLTTPVTVRLFTLASNAVTPAPSSRGRTYRATGIRPAMLAHVCASATDPAPSANDATRPRIHTTVGRNCTEGWTGVDWVDSALWHHHCSGTRGGRGESISQLAPVLVLDQPAGEKRRHV